MGGHGKWADPAIGSAENVEESYRLTADGTQHNGRMARAHLFPVFVSILSKNKHCLSIEFNQLYAVEVFTSKILQPPCPLHHI